MTSALFGLRAAARLDWGEVRRSRWLVMTSLCYAVLAAMLFVAGTRESSVFGFTGMSRVLLSLAHVLLVVLPLLALSATTQVVTRARDDGTVELLFSQPLSRGGFLFGISLARYAALCVPLLAVNLLLAAVSGLHFADASSYGMALRSALVGSALLFCFCGIGLAISVLNRNQAKAVVLGLVLWALSVALLDLGLLGLMLQWHMHPRVVFLLGGINPVQAARLALLSGIEPDLATLGPVGFYLAHTLGPSMLLAYGLGWPLAVGGLAWTVAMRSFAREDLV